MATRVIGNLFPFDLEGDWKQYIEQVEMFFKANKVEDEAEKASTLLSSIGPIAYSHICNLCVPVCPPEKTFTEIKALMNSFHCPAPIQIAERSRFMNRLQLPTESIVDYALALRTVDTLRASRRQHV
uniref:Retrotransposon gag domain-containing protein n=1 Tax=Strigamia maritima TaxID=126957 RepID=T1JFF7_STRMM